MKRLVSKDDGDEDIADHLKTLHTYYTAHQTHLKSKHPHVSEIFSKPKTREFHVVKTENPHHSSIVRVRPPDEESATYSVTTESGV